MAAPVHVQVESSSARAGLMPVRRHGF